MKYGYARCSTSEEKQDIDRQIRELKAAGADEVVSSIYYKGIWGDLADSRFKEITGSIRHSHISHIRWLLRSSAPTR